MTAAAARDHGGDLDAAVARHGGDRSDWLDLSTGINPVPYPVGFVPAAAWTALPDRAAAGRLLAAARRFWKVPARADIVAAPGASALIARLPYLTDDVGAYIPGPTYNEHAAAFEAAQIGNWRNDPEAPIHIYVHPNNPDGRLWERGSIGGRPLTVVDESFCDVMPERSHVKRAAEPGVLILKSFGKFWGLAGLRLGFAIGAPRTLAPVSEYNVRHMARQEMPLATLAEHLGPWPVSGPALEIGARALEDEAWARATRRRLADDAARLDRLMTGRGARVAGGTTLFRLYEVGDARAWQRRLAQGRVWSRVFPYSKVWLRLGLPAPDRWGQLEAAL